MLMVCFTANSLLVLQDSIVLFLSYLSNLVLWWDTVCAGDVGDHVVVINTKDIAMQGDYWRTFKYFHHTG